MVSSMDLTAKCEVITLELIRGKKIVRGKILFDLFSKPNPQYGEGLREEIVTDALKSLIQKSLIIPLYSHGANHKNATPETTYYLSDYYQYFEREFTLLNLSRNNEY